MTEEIAQPDSEMVIPAEDWKDTFIASLKTCGVVRVAAELAGISRQAAYRHRRTDTEFRQAWDSAFEDARDVLLQRAVDLTDPSSGYYKPQVASRMLQFLLPLYRTEGVRELAHTERYIINFGSHERTVEVKEDGNFNFDGFSEAELRLLVDPGVVVEEAPARGNSADPDAKGGS